MTARVQMPSISYILARTYPQGIIGRDDAMPWHLRTDLQRFKRITNDHAVLMGRKTFTSIGKPLPRRTSIVLSRNPPIQNSYVISASEDTQVIWATTIDDCLFFADFISILRDKREIFIIGGSEMFNLFGNLVNKIYLTEIFTDIIKKDGDAIFNAKFRSPKWRTIEEVDISAGEHDDFPSRFSVLTRRERRYRYRFVQAFFTEQNEKYRWIESQSKIYRRKFEELSTQGDLFDLAIAAV